VASRRRGHARALVGLTRRKQHWRTRCMAARSGCPTEETSGDARSGESRIVMATRLLEDRRIAANAGAGRTRAVSAYQRLRGSCAALSLFAVTPWRAHEHWGDGPNQQARAILASRFFLPSTFCHWHIRPPRWESAPSRRAVENRGQPVRRQCMHPTLEPFSA